MADKKISALTSSSTPLAGTEVLPIVQSGTTVKVAVTDLTAGRAVSGLNFAPTGSTIPANGTYLPATNFFGVATNSTYGVGVNSNRDFLVGTTTTASTNSNLKRNIAGDFKSFGATVTIPILGTATVLTLNSSVAGTYIISASFGAQGNAIYGGMAIIIANGGGFRLQYDGSGSRCTITLVGADVKITNGLGVALDATVNATYFGAETGF
jgi:hypothetical protein